MTFIIFLSDFDFNIVNTEVFLINLNTTIVMTSVLLRILLLDSQRILLYVRFGIVLSDLVGRGGDML